MLFCEEGFVVLMFDDWEDVRKLEIIAVEDRELHLDYGEDEYNIDITGIYKVIGCYYEEYDYDAAMAEIDPDF